jgi:penicillin G amidase
MRLLTEPFLPFLPPDLAESLKKWDGNAAADSSSYLVAATLRRKLRERALEAWHAKGWSGTISEDLTTELARAGADAYPRAGLGGRDTFLRACADAALAELSKRFGTDRAGWSWGEANRLQVKHPLGRIPGLGWLFNPPSVRQTGASAVVKASSPAYGQSMRFIVDWGAPDAATLVVPFGVSGHLGSPHRLDQFPFWQAGDPSGEATRLARPGVGTPLEFRP